MAILLMTEIDMVFRFWYFYIFLRTSGVCKAQWKGLDNLVLYLRYFILILSVEKVHHEGLYIKWNTNSALMAWEMESLTWQWNTGWTAGEHLWLGVAAKKKSFPGHTNWRSCHLNGNFQVFTCKWLFTVTFSITYIRSWRLNTINYWIFGLGKNILYEHFCRSLGYHMYYILVQFLH